MTFFERHKKIILVAAVLLAVGVGFWIELSTVYAQSTPPAQPVTATGNIASKITGAATSFASTILIVDGILVILFSFLSLMLSVVGTFLNYVFILNTSVNPGQLEGVVRGWVTLRDLANGFFILIILWIAITLIFNLEGSNVKRLLVRIIIIALLINFSLAMVSAVFAFTNLLARPFPTAMGLVPNPTTEEQKTTAKLGLSGIIVNNSKIHTVSQQIANEGVLKAFEASVNQTAQRATQDTAIAQSGTSIWNYVGNPVPEAQASVWACAAGLFGVVTTKISALCLIGHAAVAIGLALGSWWVVGGFSGILNLAMADGILLITVVALLTITILLLARLIAMVFLAIFAPIAFLSFAIPKYGERIWNSWVSNLFRWAFVAPVFYFLLYIALLTLQLWTRSLNP